MAPTEALELSKSICCKGIVNAKDNSNSHSCRSSELVVGELGIEESKGKMIPKHCFSKKYAVVTGLLVLVLGLAVFLPIFLIEKKKQDKEQVEEPLSFAKVYLESSSVELDGQVVAHYMLMDWQPRVSNDAARVLIFDDVPNPRNFYLSGRTSSSSEGESGEGSSFSGSLPLNENVTEYNPMDENVALYRLFWNTWDGLDVYLTIDDTQYDLKMGSVFLVTTRFGKPALVEQLFMDLSSLSNYELDDEILTQHEFESTELSIAAKASVQLFVDETPEIVEFLQQVASYHSNNNTNN